MIIEDTYLTKCKVLYLLSYSTRDFGAENTLHFHHAERYTNRIKRLSEIIDDLLKTGQLQADLSPFQMRNTTVTGDCLMASLPLRPYSS